MKKLAHREPFPWERLQKFVIAPRELTIRAGDLTPSMKLGRGVAERSFAGPIESQYTAEQ